MHNRIKDVKDDNDDNGDIVEGKSSVITDKNYLDGIDTRNYTNFLTLFNSLKKRNVSSVPIDDTRYLASVQRKRPGHRNVFAVEEDYTPSTSSHQSNSNSNDEHVLENRQVSKESQPVIFDTDLTMAPMNFVKKKLKYVNKQPRSTKEAMFCGTSSTKEVPLRTFDLLLNYNKRRMQINEDQSKKIVNNTTQYEQSYRFDNNITQNPGAIITSSQMQMSCSNLLFRRSSEFITRKKSKGFERIKKDALIRSLSFDASCTTNKEESYKRSLNLGIKPMMTQEMNDRTAVHINDEGKDCNLRQSLQKNSSDSKLINKKEVSFDEAASIENENYIDVNKSQEIMTLRNINKDLATKLARAERMTQLLQIQLKFYDKTNDVKFACKLADVIDQLKVLQPNDRFRDEALKVLNPTTSISVNDEKSHFVNSLLKEIEYDKAALSNPGTLRKYCEQLVQYARENPPVLMELQNQINENRILQLKNKVGHKIMMKNTSNGNIIDGSCENHQRQITSLEANLMLHREQLEMKDVQLRRLEEEIGNAHRCNQQLNAKLGSMVTTNSTNFLNQEKELKVSLVLTQSRKLYA
ncbi:RNA-directed RNA polymerase [Dirofilaria immitis]